MQVSAKMGTLGITDTETLMKKYWIAGMDDPISEAYTTRKTDI